MAATIRLTRKGTKNNPFYRIVVIDERRPRDGRFIELLGTYDPLKPSAVVSLNEEKILRWLKNGVRVSTTVKNIFSKNGIYQKLK